MRILVLNWLDRENPQAGGAELHLHETFGRLVQGGHSVDLVCSGWPDAAPEVVLDGIRVFRRGGRHSYALLARGLATRLLTSENYDVVVEDLNKVPLFAPLWTRVPVVALFHHLFGNTAFQEASWPVAALTWALERPIPWIYRGLPIVAVSESTREDLIARGVSSPIEVIPNGLDHGQFAPDQAVPRTAEPTVLSIGRLKRYKRIELVFEAIARLRAEGVPVTLLVAGAGPREQFLRRRVRDLKLGNDVRFLGFVSEDEKVRLLRSCWVHVFTSPKEGWGLTNLEAAACGTPTVASDSPGLRESVLHERTGLLVPHGDVAGLTEGLRRMVEVPALRQSCGEQAMAFAKNFTWDRTAAALERVLIDATSKTR